MATSCILDFLIISKVLKVHCFIKSKRSRSWAFFCLPQNIAVSFLTTFFTYSTRPLVSPMSIRTNPVKSMEVTHKRYHCPIILHVFHHLYVQPFIYRAMCIQLHHIFSP